MNNLVIDGYASGVLLVSWLESMYTLHILRHYLFFCGQSVFTETIRNAHSTQFGHYDRRMNIKGC